MPFAKQLITKAEYSTNGRCEPRSLINASTIGEADVVNRCNCVFASGSFNCRYGVDCLDYLALFLEEIIVQAEHMTN